MCLTEGLISIILGLAITCVGCYYLFYGLPKISEKQNATTSLMAQKVSSWLVVGGLVMMFLGILYLMGIVPWWS